MSNINEKKSERPAHTCKCQYCGLNTYNTGTKLCDGCWELKTRIEADTPLAEKILADVKKS